MIKIHVGKTSFETFIIMRIEDKSGLNANIESREYIDYFKLESDISRLFNLGSYMICKDWIVEPPEPLLITARAIYEFARDSGVAGSNKIRMVIAIRKIVQCGIKDAKDAIEYIIANTDS